LAATASAPSPSGLKATLPDLKAVYSGTGTKLVIFETDASSGVVAGNVYVRQ